MNIFEALSYGKGCINEENTSSFLAYLLNPAESHGIRTEFLKRFLNLINIKDVEFSDYNISIELEKKYGKRTTDIFMSFENKDCASDKFIVAIENKIKAESCNEIQFKEEYEGILQEFPKTRINMVFITTDECDKKFDNEFDTLNKILANHKTNKCKRICWNEITESISNMLDDEEKIVIQPMSDYLKQTLKAFNYYINHRSDLKRKQKVRVIYGEDVYDLIQFSDGSMRISCDQPEGLQPKLMIYDVLFEINKYNRKELNQKSATNIIVGTPRTLGDEMFKALGGKKEIKIKCETPCFSPDNRRAGSNIF